MRSLAFVLIVLASTATAAAQQKPAPKGAAQPALEKTPDAATPADAGAGPVKPAAPAPPPENYIYDPSGRRDPFLSLIGTGTDPLIIAKRPEGAAGLLVNEVAVRGIMQSRGALVAAVQGPDKKTYLVRQGDKLLDGTVKAVTTEGLTIVQDVNDPLSIVKQREVQKLLRSLEEAK